MHKEENMSNKLKEFRQNKGFSRAGLAKMSGVKERSIKAWEDEQVKLEKASYESIKKIAKALEVDPDSLFIDAGW